MRTAILVTACLAASLPVSACLDHMVTGPSGGAELAGGPTAPSDSTTHPDTTQFPGTRGIAPVLVAPDSGARVRQNDSSIGCPFHEFRGYGFQIVFDWTDVEEPGGTLGYHLFVKKTSALYPVFNDIVYASELVFTQCNAFVIDRNLEGWEWKVRAVNSAGETDVWSASRPFSFAPCRHADGARCTAPPDP